MTLNRVLSERWWVIGSTVGLTLLSACGSDSDPEPTTGIANPASVFCEEQGGFVEIERDAEGNETGICVLPDGTRIDEWEYFRANNE